MEGVLHNPWVLLYIYAVYIRLYTYTHIRLIFLLPLGNGGLILLVADVDGVGAGVDGVCGRIDLRDLAFSTKRSR